MRKVFLLTVPLIFLLSTSLSYSQSVYITKSGAKYHKETCRHLSSSKIEINIKKAVEKGYTACKTCKPTSVVSEQKTTVKKSVTKSKATSSRCQATTKKGAQCKRKAKAGSSYCWQHS